MIVTVRWQHPSSDKTPHAHWTAVKYKLRCVYALNSGKGDHTVLDIWVTDSTVHSFFQLEATLTYQMCEIVIHNPD